MIQGATILLLCLCLTPTVLARPRSVFNLGGSIGRLHRVRQADDAVSNTATALKNNFLDKFSRNSVASFSASGGTQQAGLAPVDIVLLLDSSGSVGTSNFGIAKTVLKDIVEFLDTENGVSSDGVRIGGVVFSEIAKTVTKFNYLEHPAQNSLTAVQGQIQAIPFDNGGHTATRVGLQRATDILRAYGRTDSQKSVFVLTDGQSNRGGNPCSKAAEMKSYGYEVFVWAIGANTGSSAQAELECIATDSSHIFKIDSFSSARDVTTRVRVLLG